MSVAESGDSNGNELRRKNHHSRDNPNGTQMPTAFDEFLPF
jgi:hypothetical protein